ncbi:hypothetical protein [Streptomyces griseorubiginosus]|uniref:hypothetical protein n=1 Tax=Streptomyces griseorubiginosus TaxID=67304 RepID=UPI001FCC6D64|nr:hypothetical protein [Streptomyces griseorubiginosus]
MAGQEGDGLLAHAASPLAVLVPLMRWAETRGADLADLDVRRPSLEDAYLALTETTAGGTR